MITEFSLNETEEKAVKQFQEQQEAKWQEQALFSTEQKAEPNMERWAYVFIPTGIGVCVEVLDRWMNESKNVTDYSCW